ncbi:uncharacterized protein ZSWIM9-like isoform X2 [Choloepus didactylus]|nr:uncharacterized protein ZSWIM9-like isoform X2 [Choloepus didactylus]XP_037676342.1 uncharacterized protein ZSWIM9-like isoform X2 [Choloepus didactylus]XP_037676343.1 uncharacterized protein ZSWIM9-like isoform X2 [Choloepus didactylus]
MAMGELGLGQEFRSWRQFSSFFDDWCERHKVLFIIASLKPLVSPCQDPPSFLPNLAKTLRFRFVRFICKHSGTYVGQSKNIQGFALYVAEPPRPRTVPDTQREKIDCPAKLTLRLGPRRDRLVVTEATLEHNHQLAPLEFTRCFRRRQLEACLGLPIRITNSVSKRFLALDLVWNLEEYSRDKDKGMCELLSQLDALFRADPGAKVKLVFQEDAAVLNSIFLATSHMQALACACPHLLFLDQAACLPGNFELYSVLCQDANGRGREVAYCLSQAGTPNLLVFIVASLVQSVPEIKARVECLTVGAALPGLDALQELLPHARAQVCRTQVLEVLGRRAQELVGPGQRQLVNLLHNLAHAASSKVYNQYLRTLKDTAPLEFLRYFLEAWHPHRDAWVACWAYCHSGVEGQGPFVDHFGSHRQKLLPVLATDPSLAGLVRGLLELESLAAELRTLPAEEVAQKYQQAWPAEAAALVAEELALARHGAVGAIRPAGDGGFILEGSGGGQGATFAIGPDLASCSCSIFTASHRPCRHLFVARLWAGRALFDASLMPLGDDG